MQISKILTCVAACMGVLILTCSELQAFNYYVRPDGGTYGSGDGSNWSNAFSGFAGIAWASISAGDTIWVAGGTYTQALVPAKTGASGARIYIRRARTDSTECTGTTGWNASFASTVTQTSSTGISLNGDYNYITISGRTTAEGGTYGWVYDRSSDTTGVGVSITSTGADYNLVEFIEFKGGGTGVSATGIYRGLNLSVGSGTATYNTFSRCKIHGWATGVMCSGTNYTIFEHLDIYDNTVANVSSYHNNGIYLAGVNGVTIRYCKIHGHNGQGTFFGLYGAFDDIKIYGNVYYDIVAGGDTGIKINDSISAATNVKIYNNSFYNFTTGSPITVESGPTVSGETRNNLFYSTTSYNTLGTASNNVRAGSNPFVDAANNNFRLSAPTAAGYRLSSPYNTDPDGVTRGADGIWDIGAYEHIAGSPLPLPEGVPPSAPSGLRIIQ